ncbi:MAG: lipid II flippase MurJ, partial [Pseudomonadota bacterium]
LRRAALRRFGDEARGDARLRARLPRLALASVAMGAVCLGAEWLLRDALAMPVWRYAALAALVGAGLASYGAAVLALGALTPADLRAALRRGPAER